MFAALLGVEAPKFDSGAYEATTAAAAAGGCGDEAGEDLASFL